MKKNKNKNKKNKKETWEGEMKKGGKKIINNESKKILPVLLSIVHEIVHKWEFAFQVLNLTFLA